MIPLLTADDVRRAEKSAIDGGVSEDELMLRAGRGIADLIVRRVREGSKAVILCGPGKNGGDGIVIGSRLIEQGWQVSFWNWERKGVGKAPVDSDLEQTFSWVNSPEELSQHLEDADIVVDAVFGAGGKPELPADVVDTFDRVRVARERRFLEIWGVDLPSGVSADTGECSVHALQANVTAMIGLPKVGAYKLPASSVTGEVKLVDIKLAPPENLPAETPILISTGMVRSLLPERRTGSHKRSVGTLMVIGGAPNYYGAPRLTGEAAMRAGTGLVSVAAPSSIIGSIATAVPELTFIPLPVAEHLSAAGRMASIVQERSSGVDAQVIGPGLGTDSPIPEFLSQHLGFNRAARGGIGFGSHAVQEPNEPFSGKAVLDADALNWLAGVENWWETLQDASLVLTPHPGELARLINGERDQIEADPWESALAAAKKFGQVVVLKYANTVVASPDGQLFVAGNAPPGLATAGSGDVLSGVIGGYLAQGLDALSAAICGLGTSLRASETVAMETGSIGYTATDIIAALPAAREQIYRAQSDFS